jgi:hypothetical protein
MIKVMEYVTYNVKEKNYHHDTQYATQQVKVQTPTTYFLQLHEVRPLVGA